MENIRFESGVEERRILSKSGDDDGDDELT